MWKIHLCEEISMVYADSRGVTALLQAISTSPWQPANRENECCNSICKRVDRWSSQPLTFQAPPEPTSLGAPSTLSVASALGERPGRRGRRRTCWIRGDACDPATSA